MLINILKQEGGVVDKQLTIENVLKTILTIDQYKRVNQHLKQEIATLVRLKVSDLNALKTLTLSNESLLMNQGDPYFVTIRP